MKTMINTIFAAVCSTLTYFYIANEGISIIENIAVLGVPIPKKIIDILEQIKDKHDNDDTPKQNE